MPLRISKSVPHRLMLAGDFRIFSQAYRKSANRPTHVLPKHPPPISITSQFNDAFPPLAEAAAVVPSLLCSMNAIR
jgi:hypothetical protein